MYIAQLERQLINQLITQCDKVQTAGRRINDLSLYSKTESMQERNKFSDILSRSAASPKQSNKKRRD